MRWWPGPAAAVGAVSVRSTAAAFGGLRCALGAAMMANPSRLGRVLGVDEATSRRTGWVAAMVGAREIALGVGSLAALRGRAGLAPWFAAQAIADGGDALAIALAVRQDRVHRGVGALVVAFAISGTAADLVAMRAAARRTG